MSFDLLIVNGDITLKNGDLELVRGQDKLIQDILKICITPANSNIYQPWYGSYISRNLIGSILDFDITSSIAKSQLQNAIENLIKLQQFQAKNVLQQVTLDEQIAGISDIQVTRNERDPRAFEVIVKILSRSFRPTSVSFNI